MYKRIWGDRHSDVATCYRDLARLETTRGDYGQAELLISKAIGLLQENLRNEHPAMADALIVLGECLLARGDAAGAEPVLQECLDIRRSVYPEEHLHVFLAKEALGRCLAVLERCEEAEVALLEVESGLTKMFGAQSAQTHRALHALVSLYDSWGRPERAAECRHRLQMITYPDSSHPD